MAKAKQHTFTVTMHFSKPMTKAEALKQMRNTVYGIHYGNCFGDEANTMRTGAIRNVPMRQLIFNGRGY